MVQIALETGATIVGQSFHKFSPGGVTGVLAIAESHLSIHTWPERGYAAFDLFMCGDTHPELAVPILRRAFSAARTEVTNIQRGKIV